MAIIDERLELADAADFAIETGTENVGDIIDLGENGRTLGESQLYLHITVDTAGDGGATNTGTTAFQLVSDATDTISTTTQTVHFRSMPILGTDLDQGDHFVFPLPTTHESKPYERYLGLQLVQAVEGEDDLVCSAWISPFPGGVNKAFPQANVAV